MSWLATDSAPGPVVGIALASAMLAGVAILPAQTVTDPDAVHLVVSVSQRTLTVNRGEVVLHTFPVGVGTGARLESRAGVSWSFATPLGVFEVGRKKQDPLWYAPDWHYVERGLPIPPAYSEERYLAGVLGDYALYISDEIAIHGTRDASSVGRASSHGCLRMNDADIAVVYPLVEIGTQVAIVP